MPALYKYGIITAYERHLLPSKNRLDKSAKIAYNKSKESTPVDGLLPLAIKEITAQLGTWGGYFRLLSLLWKISCITAIIATIRIL